MCDEPIGCMTEKQNDTAAYSKLLVRLQQQQQHTLNRSLPITIAATHIHATAHNSMHCGTPHQPASASALPSCRAIRCLMQFICTCDNLSPRVASGVAAAARSSA